MQSDDADTAVANLTTRNRLSGGALVVLGLLIVVEALRYDFGTVARMGPGFLPVLLGCLTALLGTLIAIVNEDRGDTAPAFAWRPAALVLGAILAFALTIDRGGLLLATAALVFISGAADREHTWKSLAALLVVLLVAVYAIFVVILGIPFKLIPGVL